MRLRRLGKSTLKVSPLIFGAWAIGGWYWGGTDDNKAVAAIQQSIDLGINMIDTAPMYGYGHSEKVVGRAIKGRRNKVLIATKCGLRWDREEGQYFFQPEENNNLKVYKNLRKESIIEECERSLKRLDIDVIDLYQCHWMDKTTQIEETMEALLRLKEQGKIRTIGVSNFNVEAMIKAGRLAEIASDQPKYNLLDRRIEKNVLPYCRKNKIGVIAYSPLQQGLLTGKVTPDREFPKGDWRSKLPLFKKANREKILTTLEKMRPIADQYQATFAQIALNWLFHEPGIVSAIVGIRTREQAVENAKSVDFILSDEERRQIRSLFEDLELEK